MILYSTCSPYRLEDTVSAAGKSEGGARVIGEFHSGARVMGELDDIFKEASTLLLFVMRGGRPKLQQIVLKLLTVPSLKSSSDSLQSFIFSNSLRVSFDCLEVEVTQEHLVKGNCT